MTTNNATEAGNDGDCVLPPPPIPAGQLPRYSFERDPDAEREIAEYVESQVHDETVQHAERVKSEFVVGIEHVIWDVTTDKTRYWVITRPTNLYSQRDFHSLDFTLSFHVGLMMRVQSRHQGADSEDSSPFDEVFRRQEQAKDRLDRAVEAEDFQAVGMQLRECLLSLAATARRRSGLQPPVAPKDADFNGWADILFGAFCPGASNKELRQHLKNTAHETWQLVNWLTHHRRANGTAALVAVNACDAVVGNTIHVLERHRTDGAEECPLCRSRQVRRFFDMNVEPDGDYYLSCKSCGWSSQLNGDEPDVESL